MAPQGRFVIIISTYRISMLFYLFLLVTAVTFAVFEMAHPENERLKRWMVNASSFFMVVLAGFRKEIGGDWHQYVKYHERAYYHSFIDYIQMSDLGYMIPGWIFARLGFGLWAVNVVCVGLLVFGITRLAFMVKYSNLFYLCTVPYLLIVVGMGYSRQGAAIGMISMSIAYLLNGRRGGSLWAGILSLAFHKSAAFGLLPIMLSLGRKLWHTIAILVITLPIMILFVVLDGIEEAQKMYIDREYNSAGALIRVLQVFLCGMWFILLMRKREPESRKRILTILAVLSLLSLPALAVSPSSTLIDRFILYLLPFQCYVLAQTPRLFAKGSNRTLAYLGVILINVAIFGVWMTSAANLGDWIPYKNYLWSGAGG